MRVLTVDDQAAFRSAARAVIDATPGFEQAGESTSAAEGLAAIEHLHPELVLLDVRMPGMDGIEAARRIAATHPDVAVVLITAEDLANVPSGAGSCGAAALVRKQDFNPSLLSRLWTKHGS